MSRVSLLHLFVTAGEPKVRLRLIILIRYIFNLYRSTFPFPSLALIRSFARRGIV